MNPKHLCLLRTIAALSVFAAAGTVVADNLDLYYPEEQPSTMPKKTREQVRAELNQAYREGLREQNVEVDYPPVAETTSTRSRGEVRNEAIQYVRNHKFNPDYDSGA